MANTADRFDHLVDNDVPLKPNVKVVGLAWANYYADKGEILTSAKIVAYCVNITNKRLSEDMGLEPLSPRDLADIARFIIDIFLSKSTGL